MAITFKEIISEEEYEDLEEQVAQQQIDPREKGAEFISRCFAARNAAHFAHLLTSSYAQHMALSSFYDNLIPLVDSFAETFIGRHGKFESFPNVKESSTEGIQIVGNLTKWIDSNRAVVCEFSEIQNIIDEIVALCDLTAYKLRELR